MDRLETVREMIPAILVMLMLAAWATGHMWCLYMTRRGRSYYAEVLRRRIASYDRQIFELILQDTAAAVACNDLRFLKRRRDSHLKLLRRWRTNARIVLFFITRRL